MSALNLKPTFTDRESYKAWIASWRAAYREMSQDIRTRKYKLKDAQRAEESNAGTLQAQLRQHRHMAAKMMMLREEATQRRDRILGMHKALKEQFDSFPLDLGTCKNVDFHFNKGHIEFPFLPMWALKVKGQTFYVHNIESEAPWNTHERSSGSTKGVLRFKKCNIVIDQSGTARITEAVDFFVDEMAEAA